jgi:hypothetical protein
LFEDASCTVYSFLMQRNLRRASVLVLFFLPAALFGAVPSPTVATGVMFESLNRDGSGQLIANASRNPPTLTWTWQMCAADGTGCRPFGAGKSISTAGAESGIIFRAIASSGEALMSRVWHGNVIARSRPGVRGQLRVNALVTPVLGNWSGGWDGDHDESQLAACAHANGTHCITLTDEQYPGGCPNGAAVISPAFLGWYLRVADQRLTAGTAFAASAISSPYGGRIWFPGPTVSVAIVGRIKPAQGPRAARCGPPAFRRA